MNYDIIWCAILTLAAIEMGWEHIKARRNKIDDFLIFLSGILSIVFTIAAITFFIKLI